MAVKTNVTELPESRVRVQAEVPADEVERQVNQTARELGRTMRIPGFRKGKVPPPVVIGRSANSVSHVVPFACPITSCESSW